jgi:hypothetical protein
MTSRDELLQLIERLEAHAEIHDSLAQYDLEQARWGDDLRKAAAAIRELLAQEPVARAVVSNRDGSVMCFCLPWGKEQPEDSPWVKTGAANVRDVFLDAAPVPAVDLEEFKQEAMRLVDKYAAAANHLGHSFGSKGVAAAMQKKGEARAALAAHLDKLGGK